jgi:hypothetical protein
VRLRSSISTKPSTSQATSSTSSSARNTFSTWKISCESRAITRAETRFAAAESRKAPRSFAHFSWKSISASITIETIRKTSGKVPASSSDDMAGLS